MKRITALFFAVLLTVALTSCASAPAPANNSAAAAPAASAPAAAAPAASAPAAAAPAEKPDFSKNVNVDRASDYAKHQIVLPVTDIGGKITTSLKAKEKYTIVVMTKNSTNPYMIGMWKGGEKAMADMGIEVKTLAPAQQDSIEEQLQIMESMIQQGVDAFVIHPSDSRGIMPGVDAANEADIPVAAIGTAPTSGAFMRSGVDYYETGYIVTKYLCEAAGGKGGLILLEGPPGAQNAEERKAGALDALKEFPEMELIASQTANFRRAEGMQVMENLLQGEGVKNNLKVVVGCNDEMAIGAIQALKAAGVSDVLVGGFDGSADASQAIKDGDLYVTYNTDPFGSTYLAVAYLVEYLNDGKVPEEYFIPFPSERHDPLITAENIDDYIASYKWWS